MDDIKVVTVSGFAFESPEVGQEALKEQEAIEYVNSQLNFDDTKNLLNLYNHMVRRRMFHTQVGYSYLKSIQDHLMQTDVDPASIESIPVSADYNITHDNQPIKSGNASVRLDSTSSDKSDTSTRVEKRLARKVARYQKLAITFIIISIVLMITVVSMFIIARTSNNPTILNYEEAIVNKYAAWEQDLVRREEALKRQE